MKKIARALLFSGVLFVWFFACSKDSSKTSSGGSKTASQTLTLSESIVKKGQPLVASLPAGVSASNVRWTVTPSSMVHITSGNGQAMVIFAQPGNYRLIASYPAADSATTDSSTAPVTVSDSIYSSPPIATSDTFSLASDQVTLTPISDSASSLNFLAQSGKSYSCFPSFVFLSYVGPSTNFSIDIKFSEIISTGIGNCGGSASPATSYIFLANPQYPIPNGTYPLSVTLNGVVYQGSIIVTDTDYTFDWNYSTGVIIEPLVVKR